MPHPRLRGRDPVTPPPRASSRDGRSGGRARSRVEVLVVLVLLGHANACGTPAGNATGGSAETSSTETPGPADSGVAARDRSPDGTALPATDSQDGNTRWVPNATVERVVDGDTLIVEIGGRSETVRLIGIDTPESVAPTRPVQCFGKEASLYLEAMLPVGAEISLVRDVEARDAYDRLLGYVVRVSDGAFVNLELVASGHAATLNYPPNDYYADVLARVEAAAIAAGRGLWGACGGPDVPLM